MIGPTWNIYERAKGKLYKAVGRFLMLRDKILDMQDRTQYLRDKAAQHGDRAGMAASAQLKQQIDQSYDRQVQLEDRIAAAQQKIGMVDANSRQASDLGVEPVTITVVAAAAAVIAAVAAAVIIHTQKVNSQASILDKLERKILTPAELRAVTGGGFDPFGLTGTAKQVGMVLLIGGGLYLASRFMGRGRR